MGFDLRRFTKVVDKELLCKLCNLVIDTGVESIKCEHIYCDECLKSWLKLHSVCPIDSKPLIYSDVRPLTLTVRELLLKLEIRCDFESEECQQIVTLRLLEQHVNYCAFNPSLKVKCNLGCGLQMTTKEYRSHNCLEKLASFVTTQQNRIRFLEQLTSETINKNDNGWWITNGLVFADNDTIACQSYCAQLAQHDYPLDFCVNFDIKIIKLGEDSDNIRVGLFNRYTVREYSVPTEQNSVINYRSNGTVHCAYDVSADVVSEDWHTGDTVSCEIKFTDQFCSKNVIKNKIVVYFKHNSRLVSEKSILCSLEQLYPSVYIWSNGATFHIRHKRERKIDDPSRHFPRFFPLKL